MKRSQLARGAALVSKTQLRRTTPPRQPRPQRQPATLPGIASTPQAPPKPRKAQGAGKGFPPKVREALAARSGSVCEYCWAAPATDAHHRMRRREGLHSIQNAVHLCRTCHSTRVHGEPKKAREHGFIVPTWGNVATTPVLVGGSRWALLEADGKYRTDQRGWPS